ncbi:hypothetical protein [Deinococcus apachensis]|uniref:hypothetical protein n=1 Tax=Deinococcus apachensis TaxID=309886 RepID=UPI00037BAA9C|nr:hypothetical protein [Deinococcus apachensis]
MRAFALSFSFGDGSSRGRARLALAAFALVLADVRIMVPWLHGHDTFRLSPEGEEVRRRGYLLHPLRTGLGVLAFVLLLRFRF